MNLAVIGKAIKKTYTVNLANIRKAIEKGIHSEFSYYTESNKNAYTVNFAILRKVIEKGIHTEFGYFTESNRNRNTL